VSGSCQVDFYLLMQEGLDERRMACRLALMSWERGHRTVVLTETESDAAAMDELMWESPPGRFLPHEVGVPASGSVAPVLITHMPGPGDAVLNEGDVVINLCARPVPEPAGIARLLEIVPHRQAAREASRDKYRYYRGRGIEPATHEIRK